jgi:stage II sporulation protein D
LHIESSAGRLPLSTGNEVQIEAGDDGLRLSGAGSLQPQDRMMILPSPGAMFQMESAAFDDVGAKPRLTYRDRLELNATEDGYIQAVMVLGLENYVKGVLESELPTDFHLEAMKAQAVLARTYALRPRLSHAKDGFNVCDSYLHCQAFNGITPINAQAIKAIEVTKGEILVSAGKPALALFSACAGGHTESYQFVFSDPVTNAFPPPPISYLQGVSEGELPSGYPSEGALRRLFSQGHPKTNDAWSKWHFRWRVKFTAAALEGHMHHVVETLRQDPQFSPFITPPSSATFGHIQNFEIGERGLAGTAVSMSVKTSSGVWTVKKELTIRSLFANPDLKLRRLRSARIFFDLEKDNLGLLSELTVSGFGSGHGVGLQQVGAQGLALKGLDYRAILAHYYRGASVEKLSDLKLG